MSVWVQVSQVSKINKQGTCVVRPYGIRIALFRTWKDEIFAIEDRCPHKGGPLSEGIIHGNKVTCPLHDLTIDLSTACAAFPDTGCVPQYPAKIKGDDIYLLLGSDQVRK